MFTYPTTTDILTNAKHIYKSLVWPLAISDEQYNVVKIGLSGRLGVKRP